MSPHTLSVQCMVNVHFTVLKCTQGCSLSVVKPSLQGHCHFPHTFCDVWLVTSECWSVLYFCTHVCIFFCHPERKTPSHVSVDFSGCWHEDSWSPASARRLWSQCAQICWYSSCFENFGPSAQHPWAAASMCPALLSSVQQDPGPSSRPWVSAQQ